jgi:DNA-binding MarR family transcriptional regulator
MKVELGPMSDKPRLGFRGTQVLIYVRRYKRRTGDVPSYGEIRDALGFNDRAEVARVIARLEDRGLLRRSGSGREKRIRLVA